MLLTGLNILSKDDTLLVLEKPAGVSIFEGEQTVADLLIAQVPEQKILREELRYGIVHRLDKDTSGILLVARTAKTFQFFKEQFKERKVEKIYTCLVVGEIKQNKGSITTLLGRSPNDRRKQKVYAPTDPTAKGKREAVTEYRVLERFKDYTLLEVTPKTGRKHQIRVHIASIGHPIAGDKLYGFKGQAEPEGLNRHFLHASSLTIPMPDGSIKEFNSELPEDLNRVLKQLQS